MAPEDHVVDDRLVDQVTDFDESRHGGHHPEDRHCKSLFVSSVIYYKYIPPARSAIELFRVQV